VTWHERSAAALITPLVLAALFVSLYLSALGGDLGLRNEPAFTTSSVADLLTAQRSATGASCEPVRNHAETWHCLVFFGRDGGTCGVTGAEGRVQLASMLIGSDAAGSTCDPLARIQEYFANETNIGDCVEFTMIRSVSETQTGRERAVPVPSTDAKVLPPRLAPNGAFVACSS
jgi:hypothetical protein